jgi:3-dehydroquinate dehydratase-2
MTLRVLVIHGPNLNLLGSREPDIYGSETMESVNGSLVELGRELGAKVECYQSNHEGALVDKIQSAAGKFDCIILNAAAYTHTSVAIRDAISAVKVPVIETHLSNIHARESFRQTSLISPVAKGVIMGFGAASYALALRAAVAAYKTGKKS